MRHKKALKTVLLIAGIILIVAALACFGVSMWYDHQGGMVRDAEGDFYARMAKGYYLFRNLGTGLAVTGGVVTVISFILRDPL